MARNTRGKRASAPPPPPASPAGQRDPAHALAHTVRLRRMIAGGSGTGRMPPAKSIKLYEAAIAEYGEFWRSLSEEQRGAAILQVEGTHDMTAEDVQGALATLED